MLNAPAWSYLITGVPSQRAKKFSLYIYLDDVCRNLKMVFDEGSAITVLLSDSLSGRAVNMEGEPPLNRSLLYIGAISNTVHH